jgi:hypothetical protein
MADIISIFSGTNALSFYGFLLPWLFTFAIVYGLLMQAKLFGDAGKRVNFALAFVIAFFVTGVGGPQLASFFVNFFGGSAVFLAGILVFLLFTTLVGMGDKHKKDNTGTIVFIVVVLIAIGLFLTSTGTFSGFISLNGEIASLVFWLIIIIAAAYLKARSWRRRET